MITINGDEYETEMTGKTIKEMIDTLKFDERTIAVELNEDIISKNNYSNQVLKDGDIVEVVSFVGGG